jgi:hypothetical protein
MSSVFKTERIFAVSSSVIDLGKRSISFSWCAFHQDNGVLALFQVGNAQVQDLSSYSVEVLIPNKFLVLSALVHQLCETHKSMHGKSSTTETYSPKTRWYTDQLPTE